MIALCCLPKEEKLKKLNRLSEYLSHLKEETERFPPIDGLTLRFNHAYSVMENARQDVVLNELRHRGHRDDEQSQISDSEEENESNSSG